VVVGLRLFAALRKDKEAGAMDPVQRFRAMERAAALCDLGRSNEAISRLRMLLVDDPHDLDVLALLAEAQFDGGDPDGALITAESAISIAPEAAWPHHAASVACRRRGLRPEAIAHAKEAVRLDPDNPWSFMTLARALLSGKADVAGANQAASKALELAPDEPEAHLVSGIVSVAGGEVVAAATAFRKVLQLDPTNTAARDELARLRLSVRQRLRRRSLVSPIARARAEHGLAVAVHACEVAARGCGVAVRVCAVAVRRCGVVALGCGVAARDFAVAARDFAVAVPGRVMAVGADLRRRTRLTLAHMVRVLNSIASRGARAGVAAGVALGAVAARVLVILQTLPRAARSMMSSLRRLLGSWVLWIVAVALIAMTGAGIDVTARGHAAAVGIVLAVISGAGEWATVRAITRRRSGATRRVS
jgi:Flp pilus assembly protein TadD